MINKNSVLSKEFLVCIKIYEYNQKNKPIWFSELVKVMKGTLSQATISKCIDVLFDRGMIDAEWTDANGRWVRALKITGEFTGFVKGLYEAVEICDD